MYGGLRTAALTFEVTMLVVEEYWEARRKVQSAMASKASERACYISPADFAIQCARFTNSHRMVAGFSEEKEIRKDLQAPSSMECGAYHLRK